MVSSNKTRISFTHPRDSRTFEVDVGPGLKGDQAIAELVKQSFIEPPSKDLNYALALVRTGKQLPLSQPLGAAGLQDGDVIAVTATEAGAGS